MDKKLNHIAIIPDGNRRWAREKNLPTLEGHRRGFDVAVEISKYIRSIGINTFTLWAFSTENWKRTQDEVGYLMRLYAEMIDKYLNDAVKDEVRVIHLGRKDRIPDYLLKKLVNIEEETKGNNKNVLNIALDYGGRDEIIRALHKIEEQGVKNSEITIENFEDFLDTANQPYPNPDLVIRTSGEERISGFMPWQGSYSEFLFLKKHFPDLTSQDIDMAVEEFNNRQRRFGK